MKGKSCLNFGLWAVGLPASLFCNAAILVDTSPGSGPPPGTLGGYAMAAFPADPSSEGTLTTQLTPPAGFTGSGDLIFADPMEHMKAGSLWDTWSHGYTGDVYYTDASDQLFLLPLGTMAFSLYIQPNLKDDFEFVVESGATATVLTINGNAGAQYVGFYSDDPQDPLQFVYVLQTTRDADGFAAGEFMINAIPEPGTWAWVTGLGLCVLAGVRRCRK